MPTVLKELTSGHVFELGDFSLIGRNEGATIRLSDASISRQHASIRREERDFWIVDLGSANGSYVNDVAVTSARALRNGDRVQFGAAVLLFQQAETAPGPDFSLDGKTQISLASPAPMKSTPVTLLVADLKGFTWMSTQLSSGEIADLLREWYADCTAIMTQHGGSIDKFIGDCVFACWHGTDTDVRQRALQAALALRSVECAATSPARRLLAERLATTLDCRIGLHVGLVAIGSMGKGINTALGDAVNTVFRIESLTRELEQTTLVSAAFLDGWPEGAAAFFSCGFHQVKGKDAKIEVFALRDPI